MEHVYWGQLGEASLVDALEVCMFPLSLTETTFSWFALLAPGSINSWFDLEKKFYEHFFYGFDELKLSHLTLVKQQCDESTVNYFKRFRDTKNRCFNVFNSFHTWDPYVILFLILIAIEEYGHLVRAYTSEGRCREGGLVSRGLPVSGGVVQRAPTGGLLAPGDKESGRGFIWALVARVRWQREACGTDHGEVCRNEGAGDGWHHADGACAGVEHARGKPPN